MWKTRALGKGMSKWKTHRHQDTGAPRAVAKVQVKVQAKAKARNGHPNCGKEGHKKTDCKFKTATCSNCGKVGHSRAVCRNTNTHEIERMQMNLVQKSVSKQFWCMAVRDTVDDGHCDCTEKHDVSSEHRDESKFTQVIMNIETDQNSRKVIKNVETDQNSRKVTTNIETDQNSRRVITNIETGPHLEK